MQSKHQSTKRTHSVVSDDDEIQSPFFTTTNGFFFGIFILVKIILNLKKFFQILGNVSKLNKQSFKIYFQI